MIACGQAGWTPRSRSICLPSSSQSGSECCPFCWRRTTPRGGPQLRTARRLSLSQLQVLGGTPSGNIVESGHCRERPRSPKEGGQTKAQRPDQEDWHTQLTILATCRIRQSVDAAWTRHCRGVPGRRNATLPLRGLLPTSGLAMRLGTFARSRDDMQGLHERQEPDDASACWR